VMYSAGFQPAEGTNRGNTLFAFLFSVKERFEAQINRLYAEPYASFMAGLLTGSRKGIPERLLEHFNRTGLTHIIAISGYNITIVITVISGMLFWLPLKWRFVPAVLAIAAFTLFVGASAAVVRAAVMGVLGLLALQVGRQSEVRLTIVWTVTCMLLWNPKYLWYDAGFQLSFLAVLGLTEVSPLLDRAFARIPHVLGMREALQMTIAAQLSAVPLIVLLFGRVSLIAPIANLLVAPFIPPAMLFGFLGTMLSFVWFPLGQLVAYLGWGCLKWIILAAETLSELPYASVDTGQFHWSVLLLYYSILSCVLFYWNRLGSRSFTES
jgi:competence protein ComEC